jgi:PAS domain-containing protein
MTAEPIVAVLDLELRHVACSKPYAELVGEEATRLTGVSMRSLVRDGGALDEALAPVLAGEIDFRSVELEVLADDARVALHLAMVRRADATPRGVVVVAHSVPPLSGG